MRSSRLYVPKHSAVYSIHVRGMPPRNRALLRIGIELRGATSDATPRVSPTIFSRQPEKQTWISFKTLKIPAGYDPALTPALETRTVSKYEGKFIYIVIYAIYYE